MSSLPTIIIFAGVVISAIGGFWAYRRQDSFKLKPAIMILVGVVINAVGGLWASQQTAQLNQELVDSIIGGDSFCYLTVGNIDSVKNIGLFVLLHKGKHPLYDVDVTINDLDKFDQIKGKPSLATLDQRATNFSIGTLIPSSNALYPLIYRRKHILDWIALGDDDTRSFNVQVYARNGFFGQALRLKKIDGEWVSATKVTRGWDKVIYEEIDDKFPRTAGDDVEW